MPVVPEQPSNYKQPQVGMQPGRIIKIIDLGTQKYEYKGDPKTSRQLQFGFELPEDKMDDGRPLVIGKKINLTIGDRAALTKLASACTGVKPEAGFDPVVLIGKTCNLTLAAWSNGDKSGVAIEGFAPLLKGQVVPEAANDLVVFDLDKFNAATFASLHDFYKETIAKSPEYQQGVLGKDDYGQAKAGKTAPIVDLDLDDEIPNF